MQASGSDLRDGQAVDDFETDDPTGFFKPDTVRLRSIKDPIHDYIPIHSYLSRFIDTKPFQRLRNVKQLGTSPYVWPGACHSRFEHSIGVAYLARYLASHLQQSQVSLKITNRDVACVEIAGLCHDLGHGPWSHVWDNLFIPKVFPDAKWQHEIGSEMMFDYLIETANIPIVEKDVLFIKALIAGDPEKCSPDEKPFLFDIVANKRNGLDVDKFDYIQRDSHMIGAPIHLSLTRILKSAKVLDNQICYDIKDANQIYEICAMRFKLHKLIYNHKSAKAIEYLVIDGLLAADPYLKIAERVFDPKKYLHLNDSIMSYIEASEEPELEKARKIFERISLRDLYKCVDFKVVDWPMRETFQEFVTPERIFQAARSISLTPSCSKARSGSPSSSASTVPTERCTPYEAIADDIEQVDINDYVCDGDKEALQDNAGDGSLEADDVIVDFATMHYGMKERNPLDFVKFYSKNYPDRPMFATPGVYSNLMPACFAETLLRVYTKKPKYFGLVQAGYRAVLDDLHEMLNREKEVKGSWVLDATLPLSFLGDDDDDEPISYRGQRRDSGDVLMGENGALTPPITLEPSTPRPRAKTPLRTFGRTTSVEAVFSTNSFTTVSANYAPASPTAGARRGLPTGAVRNMGDRSPDRGRVGGLMTRKSVDGGALEVPQTAMKTTVDHLTVEGGTVVDGGGDATSPGAKRRRQEEEDGTAAAEVGSGKRRRG